jgi:hypothetical protein
MVFSAGIVHSEQSKTIQYLMNEPLTMFEWGMVELKNDIDEYLGSLIEKNIFSEKSKKETLEYVMGYSDYYTYTSYDWIRNKIIVRIVLINKNEKLPIISKKDLCKKHTDSIKKHFYAAENEEFRREYGISKFFKHSHFARKNQPENFLEEIEDIVEIQINIQYTKDVFLLKESGYEIVSSISPLMGDYIYFKEKSDDKEESPDKKSDSKKSED